MSGPYVFIVPSPSGGVSGLPSSDAASQASKFYGEDIWFDVTRGAGADYVVTAAGDWALVQGVEALRQSVIRRIITSPGEWATKPNYGVGARQYVKARDLPSTRSELAERTRAQLLIDPRIETVDQVIVEALSTDGPPGIRITVRFTPRGRLRTDQPVPVILEVR